MSKRIRVFDIETTGIDPADHRVVEIAAYDLTILDAAIARVGSHLVNPGRPIPPEAAAVHHLTDCDVAGAGTLGAIWNQHYGDPDVVSFAAHNCDFERGFLPTPEGVTWICTYKAALRAWPLAPGHSNQVLRYWLKLDERPGFDRDQARLAHRAEPDTYVTAWLLAELLKIASPERLAIWTSEPKLFPILSFGKHRGQKWTEVPGDYLQWLRDGRHDMDSDWRHGAKVELERRKGAA